MLESGSAVNNFSSFKSKHAPLISTAPWSSMMGQVAGDHSLSGLTILDVIPSDRRQGKYQCNVHQLRKVEGMLCTKREAACRRLAIQDWKEQCA